MGKAIGYFDGSSIKQYSGYGFVIYYKENDKIKTIYGGDSVAGMATSNVAEYSGLIGLLSELLNNGFKDVLVRGDSQLIIRQVTGEYKVRKASLQILHKAVLRLVDKFDNISFEHVKRDYNKAADAMSKLYNPVFNPNGDGRTFEQKLSDTIKRIKAYEPEEGYMLKFTGNKESIVLHRLITMANVKFKAVYNDTSISPPEIIRFVESKYPDVEIIKEKKSMWDIIENNASLPTARNPYCCKVLRHSDMYKGKVVAQSLKRYRGLYNKNYVDHSINLNPIFDWLDKDKWAFIESEKLSYCDLEKVGLFIKCVGCPLTSANTMSKLFERYPDIQKKYFDAFENRLSKSSNERDKWGTKENIMNWWMGKHLD